MASASGMLTLPLCAACGHAVAGGRVVSEPRHCSIGLRTPAHVSPACPRSSRITELRCPFQSTCAFGQRRNSGSTRRRAGRKTAASHSPGHEWHQTLIMYEQSMWHGCAMSPHITALQLSLSSLSQMTARSTRHGAPVCACAPSCMEWRCCHGAHIPCCMSTATTHPLSTNPHAGTATGMPGPRGLSGRSVTECITS